MMKRDASIVITQIQQPLNIHVQTDIFGLNQLKVSVGVRSKYETSLVIVVGRLANLDYINIIIQSKENKMIGTCKNCGIAVKYSPSQSSGKYCSNKCQQEDKFKELTVPKILAGTSTNVSAIKKYLTETVGYNCVLCDNTGIHNNKELVLQLDHIDGNSDNNSLENLRLLCPNCHTQTDTFTTRQKKNTKRNRYLSSYKRGG